MSTDCFESVIVIPPIDQRKMTNVSKEQLANLLANRFPEYSFMVAVEAPFENEDSYIVLPMIMEGAPVPEITEDMISRHTRWEIEEVCREFEPVVVH